MGLQPWRVGQSELISSARWSFKASGSFWHSCAGRLTEGFRPILPSNVRSNSALRFASPIDPVWLYKSGPRPHGLGDRQAVTDHVRSSGYRVVTTGRRYDFELRGSVDGVRA